MDTAWRWSTLTEPCWVGCISPLLIPLLLKRDSQSHVSKAFFSKYSTPVTQKGACPLNTTALKGDDARISKPMQAQNQTLKEAKIDLRSQVTNSNHSSKLIKIRRGKLRRAAAKIQNNSKRNQQIVANARPLSTVSGSTLRPEMLLMVTINHAN